MNLEALEKIVGPVNRGKLADGFPAFYEPVSSEVPTFFNDDRRQFRPPPSNEDLSHLNSPSTDRMRRIAKAVWQRMSPAERRRRRAILSAAGKKGGHATKDMRHLHGS